MFWQAIVAAHLSATKVIDTDAIFTILSERCDEPPAVMNYLTNYRARTDKTVSFASKDRKSTLLNTSHNMNRIS